MEDLREKVYECTLAVEAHMIVDLLARAGISARVDGEFLAGAGGELPLGSTIRVRVDPSRAVEARQVIDEWEKIQPTPDPLPPPPKRPFFRSALWFLVGGVCGFGLTFAISRSPENTHGVDYDGDGNNEITYHYAGHNIDFTEFDRNDDGKTDGIWRFDFNGQDKSFERDDDFDGRYEWQFDVADGEIVAGLLDANGDGAPDRAIHNHFGILDSVEIYDESGKRVVARQHYDNEVLTYAEFDRDGDGTFEQRVDYDRYGMPR